MADMRHDRLIPGKRYGVQFRTTGRDNFHVSEWSNLFEFTTSVEGGRPKAPTNIVAKDSAGSYFLSWDKPTQNEDGTPLLDLNGYYVTVNETGVPNPLFTARVFQEAFEFTSENNRTAFGNYKGNLDFNIYSVDTSGNMSATPTLRSTVKLPPAAPTGLAVVMNGSSFGLSWTAPPNTEVKDYEIMVHDLPTATQTRWYYSVGTTWEFTYEANIDAFGVFKPELRFTVKTRDMADQLSTTGEVINAVKPAPMPPTITSWTATGSSFTGAWTAPTQNTDLSALTDLVDYEVTIAYGTNVLDRRVYSVASTQFVFSYEQNAAAFAGTARSPLNLEVRARNSTGQRSDPDIATAGNPAPLQVTGVVATQVSEGIRVVWDGPSAADDDIIAYEIWVASDPTVAGVRQGQVGPSQREFIHQTVGYNQDHYVYVTAVDEFGSRSPESARSGPVRPKSPFTVDTEPPPATTVSATTPVRDRTLSAALNVTWTKPDPMPADMAGYHVRYTLDAPTVVARRWDFVDVFDKNQASYFLTNLQSNTGYYFQIRTYDTMINTSEWSAESGPFTSSVSDVVVTDVSNSITIQTGGNIKSADYTPGGTLGWSLSTSTLDLQQGTVNARVIRAGELRSTQNVTTDGTTQPKWSLNLEGNASLNDVQVRGKIVVGSSGGTTNSAVNVASYTYGTGAVNQWAIKGDGTFEIKGYGASGTTQYVTLDANGLRAHNGTLETFNLDATSGNMTFNSSNGAVKFDAAGLRVMSGATVVADLNSNGTATFAGKLSAPSGDIGGWVLGTSTLSKNSLVLDSSLGSIYGGATTTTVGMRAGHGFWAGSTNYTDSPPPPFRVSTGGALYSTSGSIGGFIINGASGLYSGSATTRVQMQPGSGFWAGADARDSAPFRVTQAGALTATSANITGAITATSGSFTGTINAGSGSTIRGTIYASLFKSYGSTAGSGNFIEIGGTGTADPVDEMRFFFKNSAGTTYVTSMRQPSGYPGTMLINANNQLYYFFGDANNGFTYNGAIRGVSVYDNNNWVYSARNPPPLPSHTHAGESWTGGLTLSTNMSASAYFSNGSAMVSGSSSAAMVYWSGTNLRVGGSAGVLYVQNTAGTYIDAWAKSWQTGSSIQYKKNVVTMARDRFNTALAKEIRPVLFEFKDEFLSPGETNRTRIGFIAEELQAVLPELVSADERGGLAIDYQSMTAVLVSQVQELTERLEALERTAPPR